MTQKRHFLHDLIKARRNALKSQSEEQHSQTKAAQDVKRAQRAYMSHRNSQPTDSTRKAQQAYEREKKRLYTETRLAQVALQNDQLEQEIDQLNNLLVATFSVDDYLDLEELKRAPSIPTLTKVEPSLQTYLPPELTGIQSLLPWVRKKHAQQQAAARAQYKRDLANYNEAKSRHEQRVMQIRKEVAARHAEIDRFKNDLAAGSPDAVIDYFTLILESSIYPDNFPQHARLAYVPESKQLVVEYDLPTMDVIPEIKSYKYVKSRDEISTSSQSEKQRKDLYSSVIAQIALRTLHELFEADRAGQLDTIVFNGYVDTIDRATGHPARTCLITVRTNRDAFADLNLRRVDPKSCLKALNAGVSKSPAELAPVRPVVEFDMVDPRFIEETDVLSTLDQRPNLMELTPMEFESLIANLFESMGLETRQTQASRDGGVDCVAYDPRPILGGKVVIQAKRYKNTVGVSAVRDLYGTVQNEGASKGILVTTSGYGKSAFEFAEGKPLELLSGSNLLYLLSEHANLEAKIEPPEDWVDPRPDSA